MSIDTVEQTAAADQPLFLHEQITLWLAQAGHTNPTGWKHLNGGLAPVALTSLDLNVQRYWINRHWVQILGNLPMDELDKTRNARGCLMNGECDLPDYVRLFQQHVIPCALELNLLP